MKNLVLLIVAVLAGGVFAGPDVMAFWPEGRDAPELVRAKKVLAALADEGECYVIASATNAASCRATLARLRQPFLLDGYTTRPAAVTVEEINEKETVLCLVIHEGRNRQIRRMCRAVGLTVLRLTRTALGSLLLGDLPAGQYRSLTADEIAYIKGKEQESHDRRQTH